MFGCTQLKVSMQKSLRKPARRIVPPSKSMAGRSLQRDACLAVIELISSSPIQEVPDVCHATCFSSIGLVHQDNSEVLLGGARAHVGPLLYGNYPRDFITL